MQRSQAPAIGPAQVAAALSTALRVDVTDVTGLWALSGGASRQTWSGDVIMADGRELPIIVRRHPPSAASESIMPEACVLRAAAGCGVPVPAVYAATDDPAVLGGPAMIMERLRGETLPKRILGAMRDADARRRLTRQCAAALAAIHRIPAGLPGISAADPLRRISRTLAQTGGAYPALDLALNWLIAHRPGDPPAPVVLHGDFRLGNLLVDEGGLAGVLDWELVHWGDPHEDLAWLCARPWRFGGPAAVGGFGDRDELVAAYREAGGAPVNGADLHWWDVLSTLKWAVMCIEQSQLYLSGQEDSLELLALGRRISESEWDLLNDLDELSPAPGAGSGLALPMPPERASPTVIEILDGVRRFLAADIVEATSGRPRYLARVAANLLAVAARELTATLPDQGAAGNGAADHPALTDRERIRAEVAWKLRNDHPGYGP
jgi:aminoglycoside phosphotransferase (APT) family kinase protein